MLRISGNKNATRSSPRSIATLMAMATIVLLLGGCQSVQPSGSVTLDIRVGFDGYVEQGNWVPITVTASNDGDDVSGELRIEIDPFTGEPTQYVRPIELPRGSRKQVTLYAADLSTFEKQVSVDLIRQGRVLTSQQTDVQFVSPTTLLIGIWSDSPQGVASIGEVKPSSNETKVALVTADDLPPVARGWGALDVLVISDADSGQLSPEQRAALRDWLAQGGRLIITGGISFQRTLSGLDDVTPLVANNTATVSLSPLGEMSGKPFDPQARLDAPVAVGTLTDDAEVLADSDSVPLIVSRKVGYGRVDFLAADPTLEPLRSWDDIPNLWRAILSGGDARPGWAYGFNTQWQSARQAVADVPGVSLPSALQLCGFLTLYVFLIGPVNYVILWRLKRRELAWFTVPALVLIFAAIAYLTGFQVRGTQAIIHRLAVVQSWTGSDSAEVEALIGIWSPRRARYDIALDAGFLARPIPQDVGGGFSSVTETTVEEGEAVILRRIQVDVGAIQTFAVEGFTQDAPRVEGNLTLYMMDNGVGVSGDVINHSDIDLSDVALVFGGTARKLGDLPAGEVLQVNESLLGGDVTPSIGGLDPFPSDSNPYGYYPYYGYGDSSLANDILSEEECYGYYYSPGGGSQRRCDLVRSILNSDSRGSGVYLIGWGDRVPFSTQVLNTTSREIDVALYIIEMAATLADPGPQSLQIPPGLMTWRLVDSSQGAYATSPYDFYLDGGEWVAFHFEPVPYISDLQVDSFIINLEQSYENVLPSVYAWNLATGQWDRLSAVRWGNTLIEDAGDYVDSRGGIDLRINATYSLGTSISWIGVTLITR